MTPSENWVRCRPWIEAALEYDSGFYRIEDIEQMIAGENALFWPGKRSAVVTQFWHFPRNKALNYWLAGGDLHELIDEMRPCIETFARSVGCTDIILAGRPGWRRPLGEHGYAPVWTAFRKDLMQ